MMRACLLFALLLLAATWIAEPATAQDVDGPSFEDVISLRSVSSPQLSPDGASIAFEVGATEWDENRFDTEIWLSPDGEAPRPLTSSADGSSRSPRWSPDGRYLAFVSDRGGPPQLYVLPMTGGEARPVTEVDEGVRDIQWGPDGQRIAFLRQDAKPDSIEQRESRYGDFSIEDQYTRRTHLWMVDVTDVLTPSFTAACDSVGAHCTSPPEPVQLTDGDSLTTTGYAWSPDGGRIALSHKASPAITAWNTTDLSVLTVADRALTPLVRRDGVDSNPVWSPDGADIFFSTSGGEDIVFYANTQYARIAADGGTPTPLAEDFDENLYDVQWTDRGIYGVAWQKTTRRLVRLDPDTGAVEIVSTRPRYVWNIDVSPDGTQMTFTGQTASTLTEIYRTSLDDLLDDGPPEAVTSVTEQISDWRYGRSRTISWDSRDGTTIEGVLYLPADFDSTQTYPLLVDIHGGPTGIDVPKPFEDYVYPIAQWTAKGALVLQPNYRGSAGYGEDFRSLNVRDLGTGDMDDVMSGVDHLIERGIVDTTRMGAMGWSQGGYISAFLTTNTDRFAAISVGAGISDWETYYVTTDITPFTVQYLEATPWEDEAIYERTSPMTSIQQASTPTLIQHGENDARVPIPNAYKLYQGLLDQDVETRLVIYNGFGHGITKPKERLAAMWHNWQWFGRYLWQEDIAIPMDAPDPADEE